MPWKNGQGTTFEILISPESATLLDLNFDYRLSMAEIKGENRFSQFNGFNRLLTVVKGTGITFNDDEIKQFQIKFFSGNLSVISKPILENESVLDLGLIFNPNKIKASMELIKFPCGKLTLNEFDRCFLINTKDLDTLILNNEDDLPKEGTYFIVSISSL